jgi:hypothetical protein
LQIHFRTAALTVLLTAPLAAQAQASAEAPALKLTVGHYQSSGGSQPASHSTDVNLRHTSGLGNTWYGHYVDPSQQLSQDRVGWDRTFRLSQTRLLPSAQYTSGGSWNGSLNLETGERWFVGAGLSRTNMRQSVNLFFDPGDAWSLNGGYRWPDGASLGILHIRDNRDNPDQQHLRLIWRQPWADGHRLTADLLLKRGLVEGEMIRRTGLSVAYDWPRWFIRLSYDPKVNFSSQDMWRLSGGTRF